MNAKPSRKCKFNRVFANILSIFVILALAFPAMGMAAAQEPTPFLVAFPEWESVEGYAYPLGVNVRLEIDDPSTADITPDYFADGTVVETGWGGNYVKFNFWGEDGYDLKTDDIVSLIYNGERLTHRVRNLSATNVDVETDSVMGMADPGEEVFANTYDDWGVVVTTTTLSSGEWIVSTGLNLEYNSGGRAQIYDELGNSTAVDWSTPAPPPNPHFTVFPEWEFFDGLDWPDGANVSISVEGKPECSLQRESWGGFFNGNFPEGCDLMVGDVVTFTDGVTTRTHTVRNLAATGVDEASNIVSGTSDPYETVYVWQHEPGEQIPVEANESGEWLADLSGVYDIRPGSSGRSEIRDEVGNATAVDWSLPNPFIAVSLTDHWISLSYFSPDTPVTISIYKSEGSSKPVVELNRSTDASGNLFIPSWAYNWDLEPGNLVTATDGVTTKELLLEYLTLDVFDPDHDLVSGSALAGRKVDVGVGNANGEQWLTVYADEVSAVWTADFKTVGFDLTADMWAGGHVNDEDGDVTAAHNTGAREPQFVVFPEWEWFDGNNWPDGASVKITVQGKSECKVTKQSSGGFFNGSFGEGCDVAIGDLVKFTDGKTTRTHVVRNLSITAVDPSENTITGTADTGTTVYVWPHDGWFDPLQAVADDSGLWQVDLDDTGYDLQEGASGRSEIRDETGNATAVDWYVPNPFFQVQLETNHVDGWE